MSTGVQGKFFWHQWKKESRNQSFADHCESRKYLEKGGQILTSACFPGIFFLKSFPAGILSRGVPDKCAAPDLIILF